MCHKFLLLGIFAMTLLLPAQETLPPVSRTDWAGDYYQQLTKQAAALQGQTVPVVFLGDSITHGWAWKSDVKYPGGREIWDTDLAEFKPFNLGVSGDTVPNVLWRVTEGKQLDGYQAQVLVLMISVNDLLRSKCDPEKAVLITNTLELLLKTLREKQPQAKIMLLSVLPFASERNQIRTYVNDRARKFCESNDMIYFDLSPVFLDADGKLINMRDGLHPAPHAYKLMADQLVPQLRKLLQNKP